MKTIEKKKKMNVEAGMKPKDPLPSRCDWERGPTCLSKTGRSRSAPLFLSLSLSSPAPAPPPLVFRERERERQAEGGMDDYAREMMELKTLVTRTLEKKGVLAKIRVQIPHPSSSLLLLTFLRIWLTTCGSQSPARRNCFSSLFIASSHLRLPCAALVEGIFSSWQSLLLYLGFNLLNKKGSHACPTFVCIVN